MTTAPVGVLTGTDVPGPAIAQLSTMPRVDLMPLEIAEGAAERRLQLGCVAAVVACAVAVGSVWVQAHSTVNSARKNLAATQREQDRVRTQVANLAPVAAAFSGVENANRLVSQALGGEVRWSTQLTNISLVAVPPSVWLTSMSVSKTGTGASTTGAATGTTPSTPASASAASAGIATIAIQGTAKSRYDLATWLEKMSEIKGFSGVTYTTSAEKLIGTAVYVDFSATLSVTSDALSHRYTEPNGG